MLINIDREKADRSPIPWELSRPQLAGNPPPELKAEEDACFLTQRFAAGGGYTIGLTALAGNLTAADVLGRIAGVICPVADPVEDPERSRREGSLIR